jgi:hypothetical protein
VKRLDAVAVSMMVTMLCAAGASVRPGSADALRAGRSDGDAARQTLASGVVFNSIWTAASGSPPDSACPAWQKGTNDSTPQLTGGTLRFHTTACAKNTYYVQLDTSLVIPDTLVVEARLRFGDGTECVGPCGHFRQAASLAISTAAQTGILFFVGDGEIFITRGECAGITAAAFPTTDAMHTYRIVIVPGGAVTVQRDGVPVLSGHTYVSLADHGDYRRILWGEGTSFAYGTSYWEYVRHNAHVRGCAGVGVTSPRPAAFAVRAWPNPVPGSTWIAWTRPRGSRVRVAVFDASGRRVRLLRDGDLPAGPHETAWDGCGDDGTESPAGAYLCRVECGGETGVARVTRIR